MSNLSKGFTLLLLGGVISNSRALTTLLDLHLPSSFNIISCLLGVVMVFYGLVCIKEYVHEGSFESLSDKETDFKSDLEKQNIIDKYSCFTINTAQQNLEELQLLNSNPFLASIIRSVQAIIARMEENREHITGSNMFFSELLPRVVVLAKDYDRIQTLNNKSLLSNQTSCAVENSLERAATGFELYLNEILAKDSFQIEVRAESLSRLLTMEFGYQIDKTHQFADPV